MYLQKATQYQGGEYVGADEEDNYCFHDSRFKKNRSHMLFKPYMKQPLVVNGCLKKCRTLSIYLEVPILMCVPL